MRKKVGRSKSLAEKVRGGIEAKLERAEVGLLNRDYPIKKFFKLYLERTTREHSPSYPQQECPCDKSDAEIPFC